MFSNLLTTFWAHLLGRPGTIKRPFFDHALLGAENNLLTIFGRLWRWPRITIQIPFLVAAEGRHQKWCFNAVLMVL